MLVMSITISLRTEEKTVEEIDRVAEALDRNRNWVINDALASYLETQRWQVDEIKQGIADTEAGRTYSTKELLERIDCLEKEHASARRKAK